MLFGQVVSGYGTIPSTMFQDVVADSLGYAYFAPTIIRTYGYGRE